MPARVERVVHLDVEVAAQLEPAEELGHREVAEHDGGVALLSGEDVRGQLGGQRAAVGEPESHLGVRAAELAGGEQGSQDQPAGLRVAGGVVRDGRAQLAIGEAADLGMVQLEIGARR